MRTKFALLSVVLWTGCSAKLSGELDLNGEKLKLASCRSGAVYGFRGVELTAETGVRLRIASTQAGDADVVVMPAGADKGKRLGPCGSFTVTDQNSTINDVKNVEGQALLDCKADGFALKGSASFSNCH